MRGWCSRGNTCHFAHPLVTAQQEQQQQQQQQQQLVKSDASQELPLRQPPENPSPVISDSRARIPCTFFASSKGCRNSSCPYFHDVQDQKVEITSNQESEIVEDEDQEHEDDFTRKLSGALVSFDETGHILKVSLPTDFSLACITGIKPRPTREEVSELLQNYGYNVGVDCVRIYEHSTPPEMKVLVKVENPLFAQELSARLKRENSNLSAVPLPIDNRRSYCRKVHISWHKATRTAWLNFGSENIANRVMQKFNNRSYQILGQSIKSSSGKLSSGRSRNPVAWTIILSDVPGNATRDDIGTAIRMPFDRPRHIELGSISYGTSTPDVSVEVRSLLEEHGQLENFYLSPESRGKRMKAAASFQDEADARSACSLNDRCLSSLGRGKLTVTLMQSAKIKVQTTFYQALKSRIDSESKLWREQQVVLRVYPSASQPFTTLKIESNNMKELARVRKTLDGILSGDIMKDGETPIWAAVLNTNGNAFKKVKLIENDLDVAIYRNKLKRQLHFYGPQEKLRPATARVAKVLEEESATSYEIELNPEQFSWMIRGGFKSVQQALGKSMAVLNVVSQRITISGTRQEYELASAIVRGMTETSIATVPIDSTLLESDCPICFCEADNALQTSCKHVYCIGCFEDYCRSAASTSKNRFQVKCQGDEGNCSTIFTIRNLKEWLSSPIFESVLQSSFEDYVGRHPEIFRYCPTPDCGYIYRCTSGTSSKRSAYSCPNCFESTCTSCHARHGDYTCSEYKDIASGGYEALKKLKKELNIKDCPKCTTPMEKMEGCNHMTCAGCKAHICWVCMAVFEASGPCYAHMNREHGGIGLGLEQQHWMD